MTDEDAQPRRRPEFEAARQPSAKSLWLVLLLLLVAVAVRSLDPYGHREG